jgi:hypothetical protein
VFFSGSGVSARIWTWWVIGADLVVDVVVGYWFLVEVVVGGGDEMVLWW